MPKKKNNIVRIEYDPSNPPPFTEEQLEEIRKLALKPDSEIDYSDIPPVTDFTGWQRASERKRIWLDPDICKWLNGMGDNCQERANAILRSAMLSASGDQS